MHLWDSCSHRLGISHQMVVLGSGNPIPKMALTFIQVKDLFHKLPRWDWLGLGCFFEVLWVGWVTLKSHVSWDFYIFIYTNCH